MRFGNIEWRVDDTIDLAIGLPYHYDVARNGDDNITLEVESYSLRDAFSRLNIIRQAALPSPATPWIDLKVKKVVRSLVDGVEINSKSGNYHAVPFGRAGKQGGTSEDQD
jgi:hypothetical protein